MYKNDDFSSAGVFPRFGNVYDVTLCVCTTVHQASFQSKSEGLRNDTVTLALAAQLTVASA